jgi:hypothetical protein
MSNSGSVRKSSWPTMGHTERATVPPNGQAGSHREQPDQAGALVARGDYLARVATPIRRAAVHAVMANDTLGPYGVRGLLEDKNAYGHAVPSDLVSGTF